MMFNGCKVETNFSRQGVDDVAGIYKVHMGKIDSLEIYIVNGELVRREIFSDFIFGGNEQRYPFIPRNEIWIDDAISSKEYITTLHHEINEMILMRNLDMTYIQAHDSSLMLEVKMRNDFYNECIEHEKSLPEVFVTDTDSLKQIPWIPDKIKLKNIYLQKREVISNKYTVWLVDGDKVRREIYPDFGFDGDHFDYNFIPINEIWIDANISCAEYLYTLAIEVNSVEMLSANEDYNNAEKKAKELNEQLRLKMYNQLANKFVKVDKNNLVKDKGTK